MKRFKKGYTLIEVTIVIAITLIIGSSIITIAIDGVKEYLKEIEECFALDSFDNAMLNIDLMVNSNNIISIESNEIINGITTDNIVVKYNDIDNTSYIEAKVIYLSRGRLMVKYLTIDNRSIIDRGVNVLLNDVSEFDVKEKDNLIYFKIKTNKGFSRIRCI